MSFVYAFAPLLLDALGSLASIVLTVVLIAIVLFVIFKMGRLIFGLIANSILGIISIFVVNALFNLGITINLLTIVVTAIFGLPAVFLIVILKLLGISV